MLLLLPVITIKITRINSSLLRNYELPGVLGVKRHMMKLQILLIFLALFAVSCTVSKRPDTSMLPCHDGWIVDGTGSSIVWQSTHKFWGELVAQLPKKRTVDCWHKMPDGRYVIPNVDTDGVAYASTFQKIEGKYQLILEELIIRAD